MDATMTENLTLGKMKSTFPNEWVALVDYDWPNMVKVTGGVVFANHPEKRKLMELQQGLEDAAIHWTGKKRGWALGAVVDVDGNLPAGRLAELPSKPGETR